MRSSLRRWRRSEEVLAWVCIENEAWPMSSDRAKFPFAAQHLRASANAVSLRPLIDSRRVILCVGCGGVGKTTTAAALGLGAAMAGKRTLCLTIDPARRLAE